MHARVMIVTRRSAEEGQVIADETVVAVPESLVATSYLIEKSDGEIIKLFLLFAVVYVADEDRHECKVVVPVSKHKVVVIDSHPIGYFQPLTPFSFD